MTSAQVAVEDAEPGKACEYGRFASIEVDTRPLFDSATVEAAPRLGPVYRLANWLHVPTRPGAVRRELLFQTGDCFDPELVRDAERVLRARDIFAEVEIETHAGENGDRHVRVRTRDDWATHLNVRFDFEDAFRLEGVSVGQSNLLGTGRDLSLFYRSDDAVRDYGAGFGATRILGSRWDLRLSGGRTRSGHFASQALMRPFIGETGRYAAVQRLYSEERQFVYVAETGEATRHVLVPAAARGVDLATLRRALNGGGLSVLGAGVSVRDLRHPGGVADVVVVRDRDFGSTSPADDDVAATVSRHMYGQRHIRLGVLAGHRGTSWIRRRGLDSVRGVEDVRLGTEAQLGFWRSLPFPGWADDIFLNLDLGAGFAAGPLIVSTRAQLEARHDFEASGGSSGWKDLLAQTRGVAYLTPDAMPRHTILAQLTGDAGFRRWTPFQLTLGGEAGLRGYRLDRYPGERRIVLTVEDRIAINDGTGIADLGATVFADVGRIWPGEAPFGVDSGWRAAAGFGLRGGFPAGGRTVYRLDVALPIERGVGPRDLRLLLSIGEVRGLASPFGGPQLLRSRNASVSGDMFHFPN